MTRRQQLDHERYLRQRDERLRKQREYYKANRDEILSRKHETGFLTYGSNKRNYERTTEQNTTAWRADTRARLSER